MSVGRGEFVLYLSFFALSLIYLIFSGSPVENMLPRSPVIMSSEEVKVVIFGEALVCVMCFFRLFFLNIFLVP